MAKKFTYEELEKKVKELEKEPHEHKLNQEALRESEERYRALFDRSLDYVYVHDFEGNFLDANPAALEAFGYKREEIGSLNFGSLLTEDQMPTALLVLEELKETGCQTGLTEFRLKGKHDRYIYVETNASVIYRSKKPYAVQGIARDIGLRKQAEDALRQAQNELERQVEERTAELKKANEELQRGIAEREQVEELLRESMGNLEKAQSIAHIGSWGRDLKSGQGQWSDEMYRTLGLTPGDPESPSHKFFLSRVHPHDRDHTASVIEEATERKGSFDIEFRTVPINGSERIVRSHGQVECDESGIPVRRFGTNQDITETSRLQAQLLEGQKTKAIVTLAGGIAHKFNNALTPIIGNIDLLQLKHREDQNTMENLNDMKVSGLHMADLTSQLLAYARGGKYNTQILSLSNFVDGTLSLIQHTLDPAVRVETDLPLDVMDVKADGTQMQMVLSAIMANSNEAMEGPGRIRISTRNMDFDKELIRDYPGLKPGPHVCLSIKDDGKGMDEETRRRIFDPFFTTHFMGRGLGMASVYGVIKNHHGSITVESELGKGTVVRIYLPVIEAMEEVVEKVVSEPEVEAGQG